MGRLARSWHLTKASMHVLRQDKELLWMPVLSFLASLVAVAAVAGVGFGAGLWPEVTAEDGNPKPLGVILAFTLYILLAFVALFFNAAVVAGATERLAGGDPTVGSSLRAASQKAGRIFLWSLVVATVNVILQAVRERAGWLGRALSSIAGMAWNLATYFMVPVLLFENEPMGGSVRRSAGLFRKTWGETVVGEAGIGLVGGLLTVLIVFGGMALTFVLSSVAGAAGAVAGVALIVVGILVTTVMFAALGGVYKAALYRYVTSGQTAGAFAADDLRGAFHAR